MCSPFAHVCACVCPPRIIICESNTVIFTLKRSKKISTEVITMKKNVAENELLFSVFTANNNCYHYHTNFKWSMNFWFSLSFLFSYNWTACPFPSCLPVVVLKVILIILNGLSLRWLAFTPLLAITILLCFVTLENVAWLCVQLWLYVLYSGMRLLNANCT